VTDIPMPVSTYKPCPATNIVDAPNRDCGWAPVACQENTGHDGKHRQGWWEWDDGERPVKRDDARVP
jgi:hypothetical protein